MNERLREALFAKNLTQQKVAELLGVDPKTVDRWVAGRTPHPRHRYRLARLVERAEVELWPGTEAPGAGKLGAEANLFDTLDLARLMSASDLGSRALDATHQAVDLLCRAYPTTDAAALQERARLRLAWVLGLLDKRLTLAEHRDLLVEAGWLAALLGCVEFDVGRREAAEAARLLAQQMATEAGHGELLGWAFEMAAWFALVEGRWEDLLVAAQGGQRVAGSSSAQVQLVLQEAKGHARVGQAAAARTALHRAHGELARLPAPDHAEHHFVFDATKMSFYVAAICTMLADDRPAEEHARYVMARHLRPDGTSNAPMRVADCRMNLAMIHARRGDLDGAVAEGMLAFDFARQTKPSLLRRGDELRTTLRHRYPTEPLARQFEERLHSDRRA